MYAETDSSNALVFGQFDLILDSPHELVSVILSVDHSIKLPKVVIFVRPLAFDEQRINHDGTTSTAVRESPAPTCG